MNKQLSFKMPIVDGKRTKQEIEKFSTSIVHI